MNKAYTPTGFNPVTRCYKSRYYATPIKELLENDDNIEYVIIGFRDEFKIITAVDFRDIQLHKLTKDDAKAYYIEEV